MLESVLAKMLMDSPRKSSGPSGYSSVKAALQALDESTNWRAIITPGSRLDEAMKAANIYFPPAIIDALQDQYDATHVHVFGKVSNKTVKIECELVDGAPQYKCTVPMFEKHMMSKSDIPRATKFPTEPWVDASGKTRSEYVDAVTPVRKSIQKALEEAKQKQEIDGDVKAYASIDDNLEVNGNNLKDVMKVACDFYLAKHAPQYAIDFKKIIETGIDERMMASGQPVLGQYTAAAQRRGDEGKGGGPGAA